MAFIEKIPLILSLFCSLIITITSMFQNVSFQTLCTRASITLVLFYVVGIIVRAVLQDMENQVKQKLEEEALRQAEEAAAAAELETQTRNQSEVSKESRINQHDDEFKALKVKELMMQGEELN